MQRKQFERFGEWTQIGAATYGMALLALFTYRALIARQADAGLQNWWPDFARSQSLGSWVPLALLWGTLFLAPAIWSLDRTNLWKSIPQLGLVAVASSSALALLGGWLGSLVAAFLAAAMLVWIRRQRHRLYDAPRHSRGFGAGRRSDSEAP